MLDKRHIYTRRVDEPEAEYDPTSSVTVSDIACPVLKELIRKTLDFKRMTTELDVLIDAAKSEGRDTTGRTSKRRLLYITVDMKQLTYHGAICCLTVMLDIK
jgi:hypothetical protein